MGGAGRHCHCNASNFCTHVQVLPGAQTIKIPCFFKCWQIYKNHQESATKFGQTCQRLPTGLNYKWLPGITKQEGMSKHAPSSCQIRIMNAPIRVVHSKKELTREGKVVGEWG